MGKEKDSKHDDDGVIKPDKGGLLTFIYDKKTGLVMGRDCKAWCQLISFYLVFYAFLVGFWVTCMVVFLYTTNLSFPTLTGYQSMLKLNPAIGYRPQPNFENNLIMFNSSASSSYQPFKNDVDTFLKPYFDKTYKSNLVECDGINANSSKATGCKFDPVKMAPACFADVDAESQKADFKISSKPCILLKMNRILGWMPSNTPDAYSNVKVRCYGENDADVETVGNITYYPGGEDEKGSYGIIPWYYFPFLNQKHYLSPLVFAHFANLKPHTLALIWCEFDGDAMNFIPGTYWVSRALNERAGGAHFELVVDK